MRLETHLCFGIAVSALVLIGGCSEGPIKTVPVSGTVTFVGREAPQTCDLIFQPLKIDGPLRPSFADREPDGNYRVRAFKNSKGLIPGTYHVEVRYYDLKPGADPKLESSWKHTEYDGGELSVDAASGGVEYNIDVRSKG